MRKISRLANNSRQRCFSPEIRQSGCSSLSSQAAKQPAESALRTQRPSRALIPDNSWQTASSSSAVTAAPAATSLASGLFQGPEYTFRVEFDDFDQDKEKLRVDAFLCARLETASRAKIQSSIKHGLVNVNGRALSKASQAVKLGDVVRCCLLPPQPLAADPEALPLTIVHEDINLLVINKAAGMVVHPSPGHYTGTLVNALLHHCGLPAMQLAVGASAPTSLFGADSTEAKSSGDEDDEVLDEEDDADSSFQLSPPVGEVPPVIRPGIVHRLDKGTTGLLVVAKDDVTHARLCDQFKAHTVERSYLAICIGLPKQESGCIETNIGRDPKDRKRMAPFGFHSAKGRHAVSRWQILEPLAGGRAALLQWQLETGRTHQIRVHAKHAGYPILGDDSYGGGASTAVSIVAPKASARQEEMREMVKALGRPALHAQTLGFLHPGLGEQMRFTSELPEDFSSALKYLRDLQ